MFFWIRSKKAFVILFVPQVQQLTFGDGVVVCGSEQDGKLLHQLNIASNVDVSAKINMVAAAQLKEV